MKKTILSSIGILAAISFVAARAGGKPNEERNMDNVSLQIKLQKKAMRDILRFSSAISYYIHNHGRAPAGNFYSIVNAQFTSWGIPCPSAKDPWGNVYLYSIDKTNPEEFALASCGRDGIFKGWSQSGEYAMESPDDFDRDIIFLKGEFTFAPRRMASAQRNGAILLDKMNEEDLIDKYYDARIRLIEIDRIVNMLDEIDLTKKAIDAKVTRIELLKLKQRRELKILESIQSVIAQANCQVKRIASKRDLLTMTVVVPPPYIADHVLRGLESQGCFSQITLVRKPAKKRSAIISCGYNYAGAGKDPIFSSLAKKDYRGASDQLLHRVEELETWRPLFQNKGTWDETKGLRGLGKKELIRKIENIQLRITKAEQQQSRLRGFEKEKEEFEKRLNRLEGILPERNEMEKTRQELLSLIKEAGIVRVGSRRMPVKKGKTYFEYPFAFFFRAEYIKLIRLFDQLAGAKHIFIIEEFQLAEGGAEVTPASFQVALVVSFCLYN